MDDVYITLEGHEQRIKTLEREIVSVSTVQKEIRSMNETLITLASELKHTNEHLERHERKIEDMENQPKARLQQIVTAIISALAGAIISLAIGFLLSR